MSSISTEKSAVVKYHEDRLRNTGRTLVPGVPLSQTGANYLEWLEMTGSQSIGLVAALAVCANVMVSFGSKMINPAAEAKPINGYLGSYVKTIQGSQDYEALAETLADQNDLQSLTANIETAIIFAKQRADAQAEYEELAKQYPHLSREDLLKEILIRDYLKLSDMRDYRSSTDENDALATVLQTIHGIRKSANSLYIQEEAVKNLFAAHPYKETRAYVNSLVNNYITSLAAHCHLQPEQQKYFVKVAMTQYQNGYRQAAPGFWARWLGRYGKVNAVIAPVANAVMASFGLPALLATLTGMGLMAASASPFFIGFGMTCAFLSSWTFTSKKTRKYTQRVGNYLDSGSTREEKVHTKALIALTTIAALTSLGSAMMAFLSAEALFPIWIAAVLSITTFVAAISVYGPNAYERWIELRHAWAMTEKSGRTKAQRLKILFTEDGKKDGPWQTGFKVIAISLGILVVPAMGVCYALMASQGLPHFLLNVFGIEVAKGAIGIFIIGGLVGTSMGLIMLFLGAPHLYKLMSKAGKWLDENHVGPLEFVGLIADKLLRFGTALAAGAGMSVLLMLGVGAHILAFTNLLFLAIPITFYAVSLYANSIITTKAATTSAKTEGFWGWLNRHWDLQNNGEALTFTVATVAALSMVFLSLDILIPVMCIGVTFIVAGKVMPNLIKAKENVTGEDTVTFRQLGKASDWSVAHPQQAYRAVKKSIFGSEDTAANQDESTADQTEIPATAAN